MMKMKWMFAALLCVSASVQAQENLTYQKPSEEILQLADYTRPPSLMMNSEKTKLVFLYRSTYKTLSDLNVNEMRLAGLRINPETNISSSMSYVNDIKLRDVNQTQLISVEGLPTEPKLAFFTFSPDESQLAFTHTTSKGVELWVIDVATAKARKLTEDKLNANAGSPFTWLKDSKSMLVSFLPKDRNALLSDAENLPTGPTVSTSDGKVSQNRTYPDLLKNPKDEANFETLMQAELFKVGIDGRINKWKDKAMYSSISVSPDGNYVLLTTIHQPFSYIVPLSRFPMTTEVVDLNGKLVKNVNEVPLTEVMPKGFSSTRTGKRSMYWRADEPASLVYVEALDGGDANKEADFRDEVFSWKAPFVDAAESIFKTKSRFGGIQFTNAPYILVSESWYDTRNTKTHLLDLKNHTSRMVEDRNSQDVYQDPGAFNTVKNQYGRYVVDVKNDKAYLLGEGLSASGAHPFIDELDFKNLKKNRLYTSKLTHAAEHLRDILDIKKGEIFTLQESPTDYPNYYIKNIKTGKTRAITQFENPFVSLKNVHKELITYKREDGVDLSGTLYLPAGYDMKAKTEKLPLLIWAYPYEFKDKNTAGQNTQNPNDFTYPSYGSFIYWVSKGYAVLDDAAFPIIGEGKSEPNDTFMKQLVANAKAAIDAVDALGYINRKKVAIGGHSYGAFMTANLLTHSNLFACGIARSGAYNRTLTPFGFQSEQRNYWDVPQIYNEMSPFMHADQMNTPLLLIHGDADNNPGTFTLQTERYYQALKNLGKPARMVLLPKEQHGYVAKENIFHVLWEQDQFLEKYLKN